jgi:tRNA G18 (ribose-2'-O)-methylase SpoU
MLLLAAEPEEQEGAGVQGLTAKEMPDAHGIVDQGTTAEQGLRLRKDEQQQQQVDQQRASIEAQQQVQQVSNELLDAVHDKSDVQEMDATKSSRYSRSHSNGDDWQWFRQLEQQPVCLVLGAEGQGLSSSALAVCRPLSIPMVGDMESLNVGVAGGILMFMLSQGLRPMLLSLGRLQNQV